MRKHGWLLPYEMEDTSRGHVFLSTCNTGSRLYLEALETLHKDFPDGNIRFTGAYDLGEEMDGENP